MPKLSKSDEKFLRDVGISAESITSQDEELLELARLPKRARLDLLTMLTLQRLMKEFGERSSEEDNR